MAQTEIDLTAAEVAHQQGVHPKTFNTWKRVASSKTGKRYGYKVSKTWYYSPSEVSEILEMGRGGEAEAPHQVYEAEDVEACQDSGFMVLAQSSQAIVQDLQAVMAMAAQQEQQIAETAARYLAPENRTARVLQGISARLHGRNPERLEDTLAIAFGSRPLLPQTQDWDPVAECL